MRRADISEHDIQSQILDWLRIKRIFHWRNNSGAVAAVHNGKKRFIRFGAKGSPDIVAVRRGVVYGIEVKRADQHQSIAQTYWQTDFERAGGVYVLARSVGDVERRIS